MAEKARFFKDHRGVEFIMSSSDSRAHKPVGRGVRNFVSAAWAGRSKMTSYVAPSVNLRRT